MIAAKVFFLILFITITTANGKLILDYNFEDNNIGDGTGTVITDYSKSGNNGVLRAGAEVVSFGAGSSEKSLKLSSEEKDYDSIVIKNSESLSIIGDLTISLWVKPFELRDSTVVTKSSDINSVSEYSFSVSSDGKLKFIDNSENNFVYADTSPIEVNRWTHIAVVRKRAAGKLIFYVNGEKTEQFNWSKLNGEKTSNSLLIGACDSCSAPFIGKIDCIRVHNSAESKKGVEDDMKSCKPEEILGPKIDIEKATNGVDADTKEEAYKAEPNESIVWSYRVANVGTEILANITVNDDKEGEVICPKSTLQISEAMTCKEKRGKATKSLYKNSAIVRAVSQESAKSVEDSDDSYYMVDIEAKIDIEKSTNYKDADRAVDAYLAKPYEKISWRYAVRNTGSDTIKNIKVIDNKEGRVICPRSELKAGESMACNTKIALAKQVSYENNATVEGVGVISNANVIDEDSSHYRIDVQSSMRVENYTNKKDADTKESAYRAKPNEDITWSYLIVNKGTETLTEIKATDDKEGKISCPSSTLAAGKSMNCSSKKGKADRINYENKLTVTAVGDITRKKIEAEDMSHYMIDVKTDIDIEKRTNSKDADSVEKAYNAKPNEAIIWSYEVKNSGTEDLNNVAVSDNKEGAVDCPKSELKAGESMTCAPKNGIADSLKYENIASVQGVGVYSKKMVSDSDKSHYIVNAEPKVDIEVHTNTVDADTPTGPLISVQEQVKWEYIVANLGNEAITEIRVTDSKIKNIDCPQERLDINETMICEATGVAAEGQYENSAKVAGVGLLSKKHVKDSDLSHYFGLKPSVDLEKHTNGKDADTKLNAYAAKPNESIIWEYIVTNNGNEKLVNITVTDDKEGDITANCPVDTLEVGKSMVCQASSKATLGQYTNSAIVHADGESSGSSVTDKDSSNYKVDFKPEIKIEKHTNGVDADKESIKVKLGDTITWEYAITNSGNEKLINIKLVDDKEGVLTSKCPATELEAGKSMTCVLKGEANKYKYRNSAKVTADGELSGKQVSNEDSSGYQTSDLCIGNYIWHDINANGVQDSNEKGMAGVAVSLLDASGNPAKDVDGNTIAAQKTNAEGLYKFCKLEPLKSYKVEVTPPSDYILSPKGRGGESSKDSDINPKTGLSSSIYLEQDNTTIDAGVYSTACIGGYFWNDKNADGIQGAKEAPLSGVKVTLFTQNGTTVVDAEGNPIGYIRTNYTGKYKFCKLLPGSYYIKVTPPKKRFNISPKNIGDNRSKDSDINQITLNSAIINLKSGEKDLSIDGGMYESGCLGNRVWLDSNGNGIQDVGEGGVANTIVEILNADGSVAVDTENKTVVPILTGDDGYYHFCDLAVGHYKIKVTPPAGYFATLQNRGKSDSLDSDIDPKDNESDIVNLTGNRDRGTLDIGLFKPACIGDFVWHDHNANGVQDRGDEGVAGVKLELLSENGEKAVDINGKYLQQQFTQKNGAYKFCQLRPGDYKIRVVGISKDWHFTFENRGDERKDSDIDTKRGESGTVSVKSGAVNNSVDIGIYKTACIGEYIWEDLNGNGIQDKGEPAIEGATVKLYGKTVEEGSFVQPVLNVNGVTVHATTTSKNGKYRYCNLIPGEYQVEVIPPKKYKITHNYSDNKVDAHSGKTETIHLSSGENNFKVDAGMFTPGCIKGFVWEDMNANGVQDSNAIGLGDIEMTLIDSGGKRVLDSDFKRVKSVKTDSGGKYNFCNLTPNIYKVEMLIPKGHFLTKDSAVVKDKNSSSFKPFLAKGGTTVKSKKVILLSRQKNISIDGGVFKPACIGNYTWIDKNTNGLQDKEEKPLAGVKVQVLSKNGTEVRDTQNKLITELTTDTNGLYNQCNLIPGAYRVKFSALKDKNNLPYISTKRVDSVKGSVIPPYKKGSAVSDSIVVKSGEENSNLDAGYIQEICLGDYIWKDKNANNVKDKDEEGISGIDVKITYSNGESVKDIYGNKVNITKTDKSGYYRFCHLMPTIDYIIKYKRPKTESRDKENLNVTDKEYWENNTTERKIYVTNPVKSNAYIHNLHQEDTLSSKYYKYVDPSVLPFLAVLAIFGELYVIFKRKEDEE